MNVYFGSYTANGGLGVTHAVFDASAGALDIRESYSQAPDPSYLCFTRDRRFLLTACEAQTTDCQVGVYACLGDGSLDFKRLYPAPGIQVCHVSSRDAMVLSCSYGYGFVHRYALGGDGQLFLEQSLHLHGSGPVLDRQAGPHAHQATITPGGSHVFVCDLGSDHVWVFRRMADGALTLSQKLSVPPGTGPRHIAWHPDGSRFYLACELSGAVFLGLFEQRNGTASLLGCTLSEVNSADSPWTAAVRVHRNGSTVAVSNRRSGTVVFLKDCGDHLELIHQASTGGKVPRDVSYDPSGRWLLAVHQEDTVVTAMPIDTETGLPTDSSKTIAQLNACVSVLF